MLGWRIVPARARALTVGACGAAALLSAVAGCTAFAPTQPTQMDWTGAIANGVIPGATVSGGGLYLPGHLACIVAEIRGAQAPWSDAYQAVYGAASGQRSHVATAVANYDVPGYYEDPSAFSTAVTPITTDADAAYELALVYALSGDTSFAAPSAAIIRAWATTNTAVTGHDGALSMAEVGVGFILAGELLDGYAPWTAKDSAVFRNWVRTVYLPSVAAPIRDETNNWGDWGSFAAVMADYYLGNLAGLDSETVRLQGHIDSQIASDGTLPEEIARGPGSAIWYTYYALDPLTAAATVIRNAGGPDLFVWTSPQGRTIKSALDHLLWMLDNESTLGYAGPRPQDPWPADLLEAMGDQYGDAHYSAYAAPKRPVWYVGHHYAWAFPTLEGAPASICPSLGRAPTSGIGRPRNHSTD